MRLRVVELPGPGLVSRGFVIVVDRCTDPAVFPPDVVRQLREETGARAVLVFCDAIDLDARAFDHLRWPSPPTHRSRSPRSTAGQAAGGRPTSERGTG